MRASKYQCQGCTYNGHSFNRCDSGASYMHEGKMYCKRHHPPTVRAKDNARNAAWQEKQNALEKEREKVHAAKMEVERRASMFDELLTTLIEVQHYITDNSHRGIQMQEKVSALIAKAEAAK